MPRSLSLTAAQINSLSTGDNTILYNSQTRDVLLYGGVNLGSKITQLEIDNLVGNCLTLKYNASATNFANFTISDVGSLDVNVNGGGKFFNIVNHNGSTGLKLAGTLVTSSANQLNYNNITTIGTAQASKALVVDSNKNISGINSIETTSLYVNGVQITSSGSGSSESIYTSITTIGVAQASRALILDTSKNITGINSLSSTYLVSDNIS